MEIAPTQRSLQASQVPLERLAGSSQLSESDKVGEASRQFEALLLRQILAEAQKPSFKSAKPESTTSGIYRDLITNQLADSISQSRAVGLGDALAGQLRPAPHSVTSNPYD